MLGKPPALCLWALRKVGVWAPEGPRGGALALGVPKDRAVAPGALAVGVGASLLLGHGPWPLWSHLWAPASTHLAPAHGCPAHQGE